MQFEYNYLQNTLSIQKSNQPPQLITKTFLTNGGSPGFILDPDSHWITFTIYPDKIRVFYKQIQIPSQESILKFQDTSYYQRDLPKTNPLIFTFEPSDEVQKINGIGVKKS